MTWSINSICHVFGEEAFESRDKSRNVWWLAIPSFGESWHNLHHSDPTCARHGALKGQIDLSAGVIRWFEKAGLGLRRPLADARATGREAAICLQRHDAAPIDAAPPAGDDSRLALSRVHVPDLCDHDERMCSRSRPVPQDECQARNARSS